MTPDEKAQFDALKRRVELLERVDNIDNVKLLKENLLGIPVGASDTDVTTTISISIGAGGGTDTADVLDYPDGFLKLKLQNGSLVYVPYYNATRF